MSKQGDHYLCIYLCTEIYSTGRYAATWADLSTGGGMGVYEVHAGMRNSGENEGGTVLFCLI